MSAGVPWHEILPIPRGWRSEKILTARLGEEFSLDSPFHRTPFNNLQASPPNIMIREPGKIAKPGIAVYSLLVFKKRPPVKRGG